MSRFLPFAAFDLSALGNRRPGAKKEALGDSYPAPAHRGHRRQTVKPRTAGARRQDRPGQLSGKPPLAGQEALRVGFNLRARETTRWRTNAEPPQRCSKRPIAGGERLSEGSRRAKRRRPCSHHNLYYWTFKAQTFRSSTTEPGRPTGLLLSGQEAKLSGPLEQRGCQPRFPTRVYGYGSTALPSFILQRTCRLAIEGLRVHDRLLWPPRPRLTPRGF